MTKLRTFILASAFGLATVTGAAAFTPQIPTPANPHPAFPIATDGSPLLPPIGFADEWAYDGAPDSAVEADLY